MEIIGILAQFSAIFLSAIFFFAVIIPNIVSSFGKNVISGIIAISWWIVIIYVALRVAGFISKLA